jgi:hypothetical protein
MLACLAGSYPRCGARTGVWLASIGVPGVGVGDGEVARNCPLAATKMDDLTAAPRNRAAVPTFASYVPVVSTGVTDGIGTALAHMLREDHVACRV